jgi:hypothetical protein
VSAPKRFNVDLRTYSRSLITPHSSAASRAKALEHWDDIPEEHHTGCLVRQLERLRELCADRLELYQPLAYERRALVARRALDA